jgi:ArsR family transcriptional regulator, lead/cadmium/zinc/bismuth-responsive transcriptional repressor
MSNTSVVFPAAPPETDACEVSQANEAAVAAVRPRLLPAHVVSTLAETFKVLGDPTRVRILDALSKAELCVCDLASLLDVSESATSHQLRLLRNLRLVRSRRAGRMIYYALDDEHITRLFAQGLEHVEESMAPRQQGGGRS